MPPPHIIRCYLVSMVASMCMVEFGYDGTMFSNVQVLPQWTKYFHNPNSGLIGAVTTAYNVTAVVFGYFVSPVISDRLGRKWTIGTGSAVVIIASLVMTFAPNIGAFIAARAIAGIGQGIAMPAGPVYIEEMVYAKTRGRLMSIWQIFYGIGNKIATYVALGCVYAPYLGAWQWRLVVLLHALTPTLLIIFLFFCPETPRWYVQHGRIEEARASLSKVRLPEEVEPELREIQNAVLYEQERVKGSYKQLLINKSYRYRLILAIIMNIGQQFSGINSLTNYSGIILKEVFPSSQTVLVVKAVEAVVITVCPFIAFFFIDKWGRRPMFIGTCIGMGLSMMTIATVVTQTPEVHGKPTLGVGIATVILILVYHVFYGPGWGTGLWIWTSEIWPIVVRANGVAISSQSQQLAGIVLGQAFPSLLARAGFYSFYFFMGTNFLLAIFCWVYIKETKGIPLEHMDTVFGGVDHVLAGEQQAMEVGETGLEDADRKGTGHVHVENAS